MSEGYFQGFSRFSRPEIGLASDGFANLAEIFTSDKRDALRNIQIDPETLDSFFGLSQQISGIEDLRSASGLDRLLLPSLHQLNEVFLDRIPTPLFVRKEYYSPDYTLGGSSGSPSLKSQNAIIFNGSIQCESFSYRSNSIGDRIFGPSLKQTVSMSTSRASLFNSELGTGADTGYYKSARYPGSIRVRRRSHVNRIFVPKTSFLTKPEVFENPTHTINVNIDNGNTGQITPVKLLATKNTPMRIYCRMSVGKIKFKFNAKTTVGDRFYYGVQIQPAQQIPNTAPVDFISVIQKRPDVDVDEFEAEIDISRSGFQNLYNVYLYVYVNPARVTSIEFSGINIREFPDGTDLGLIGFNNLEQFRVNGGSMSILPLWLKTLDSKLKVLDLSRSGDTWRSGLMGWFDIRNPDDTVNNITGVNVSVGGNRPLYTVVSYLTTPKKGIFLNEEGDDWNGSEGSGSERVVGTFEKYIKNQDDREIRPFTALERLVLGDRFYAVRPRFDDVFPELKDLDWSSPDIRNIQNSNSRLYRYIFGSLPKMKNNGKVLTYDIRWSGAEGDITDIGTSLNANDPSYVSFYKFRSFLIGGRDNQDHNISGYINNPEEDWTTWRENTVTIDIRRTNVEINLQEGGPWNLLESMSVAFSGGVKFDSTPVNYESRPIRVPKLKNLDLYGSSSTGIIPSLGSFSDTGNLETISIGGSSGYSAIIDNSIRYLLPKNFAEFRNDGEEHKITSFSAYNLGGSFRLRKNDLVNLYFLEDLRLDYSGLTGIFPPMPLSPLGEKGMTIYISYSKFYNLKSMSIVPENQEFSLNVSRIEASNMNQEGGGCVIPDFEGFSQTRVNYVDLNSSLPSYYPFNWYVPSLRNTCVRENKFYQNSEDFPPIGDSTKFYVSLSADEVYVWNGTEYVLTDFTLDSLISQISGLSLTTLIPESSESSDDRVYILTGVENLSSLVQVNDSVRTSQLGENLATVYSVSDTQITISGPVNFTGDLFFARKTVDITNWFSSGFIGLGLFSAKNCKLSGQLNIKNGFSNIQDSSYSALDLSDNMISGYGQNSMINIFDKGSSRKVTIDLSKNCMDIPSIKRIIEEISLMDGKKRYRNCIVRLSGNKLTPGGLRNNYTQQEIFPISISPGPDIVTSLTRTEQFAVYQGVEVVDEDFNTQTSYSLVENISRRVLGQFIEADSLYYTKKVDKTQVSSENELAIQFKRLDGIKVDLGFTYQSPDTRPKVISTEYLEPVDRYQSITDLGFEQLTDCPTGVPSGKCWKSSTGLILRLTS